MSAFIPISLLLLPLIFLIPVKIRWKHLHMNLSSSFIIPILGFLIISLLAITGVVALLYVIFSVLFLSFLLLAISTRRSVLFVLVGLVLIAIPTLLVAGAERSAEVAASTLFVLLTCIVLRDTLYDKVIENG